MALLNVYHATNVLPAVFLKVVFFVFPWEKKVLDSYP